LYGKISNSKIEESCSLKSCGNSTFVLRLFKVLSADGCALASKVFKGRKAKKVEIFQYFGFYFFQKLNVCACLTCLIKPDKKKITLDIL
jgi:hypothetical protein